MIKLNYVRNKQSRGYISYLHFGVDTALYKEYDNSNCFYKAWNCYSISPYDYKGFSIRKTLMEHYFCAYMDYSSHD